MSGQKISFWRIRIIYFFFVVVVSIVTSFLFRWQILEYDRYRVLANQRVKDSQLASLRGSVLASDGSPLAYSVPVYDVYAYLPEIEYAEDLLRQTRSEFVRKVTEILVLNGEELEDKLSTDIMYTIVAREVSVEQKESLESLLTDKNPDRKLEGLHFEPSEKRIYPDKTLASHIIGFVGKNTIGEDIGRNGIEGYWNGDLAWKKGFIIEETDSFGNQILTGKYEPIYPKVGRSVRLTIDRGLQEIIERKIEEGVKEWDAVSGTIIILDPRSGAILAIANYPTYDPNVYWEFEDFSVFKNKAVSDPYEFGSVGKCFTAAAAIDLKKVNPDTVIFDHHEGCVDLIDDKQVCTSNKKASGPMDLTDVLAYSDNIGAYFTAEKVGPEYMYRYLREFGIGSKTNVGLSEESTSFLKSARDWNIADLATYSYGQGYSATPLQIVSAVSAITNKGKRMQPYIVSKIYDDEKVIEIEPQVASEPISRESAIILNEMLTEVFDRNGSKWTYKELLNYKLAGKSGTASVLDETGLSYSQDQVNVTFVGWDSSDNPKFVMLIKLQEPTGAPFSVQSVQPLWMETFFEIKDFVGVVPIVK
ncbi:penicillin-binding protein 2 [Candidatus Dojkabacteria bacterium]|nr:penicillin-binding protein 2 [Candidatus Dojkabacteria bacterium]